VSTYNHSKLDFILKAVLITLPLVIVEAHAQGEKISPGIDRTVHLERVIVSAGREKVAVDTPQAVTVLDQAELDQAQATTIGEVFDQVPGITAIGSDRIAGQSFNIRGVGGFASADESKIIVTVDGATKFYEQYRMGSLFTDPELYKQIEILRGPASSTLYGSGAYGGVINLTTKDASDFIAEDEKGMVRLKGAYDSNNANYLGSLILATKFDQNTDLLITGNYRESDDYEDGDGDEIQGSNFDSWSGLIKGTHWFGVDKEQSIRLSFQRWESDLNDTDYSQTGSLESFGTIDRKTTDDNLVFSYENPASNNPWLDMAFNLSYSKTKVIQDDSKAPFPFSIFLDSEYGYKTISGKLENTFEMVGDNFDNFLTVGVQASHQTRTAVVEPAGMFTSPSLGFHPEGVDKKVGVYAQNEFIVNDVLTLIPGVRVDFVKLEPDSSIASASDTNETLFSPKLAALYQVNDVFSVFGSYAHTERTPTLDEMFSSSGPGRNSYPGGRNASLDLSNETSNNYELGFAIKKDNLFASDNVFRLKTTLFYNDLKDLIGSNIDRANALPVSYYINVNKAFIKGAEVEAAYYAERHFARVAYSHLRGEDKTTGETLTSIPSDNIYLTLGGRMPEKNLEFGWTTMLVKAIDTGSSRGRDYSGYGINGIYVSWQPEQRAFAGFELRASVNNLFDKDYRHNLSGDDGKGRAVRLTLAKSLNF